jgi:hypothetical protein
MIRNSVKLLLTLCILTVGGGSIANAQIGAESHIQADVPFSFVVGNSTLPAGTYEVRRLDDANPNLLEISSPTERRSVIFNTENAQTRDGQVMNTTELVFDRVGDQYFLSQVWEDGSISGNELPKSRMEKRLADSGYRSEKQSTVAFLKR